jgi:murein DD-endopeptidase MepM/ murein hydrolase activator NlpD
MRTQHLRVLACLLLALLINSCTEDIDRIPEFQTPKNKLAPIDQFLGLSSFLTRYVGNKVDRIEPKNELNAGGVDPIIERVDFERVMARLDVSGQTYMSMLIRNDQPHIIQNLVVGKGAEGEYQRPMIFTYTMSDAFYQTYLQTGLLEGFEGTIDRVYLDSDQIRQNDNMANMALSTATNTSCSDSAGLGGEDQPDFPDTGGGGYSPTTGCRYEVVVTIERVYTGRMISCEGDDYMTTECEAEYYDLAVSRTEMVCDDDFNLLSTADANCGNPDDGEIPINDLDPPCPGDPVKNPLIAQTDGQGVEGGRFGSARGEDGSGTHKGLDIFAEENTELFSIVDGMVLATVDGVSPNSMSNGGDFGNYIIIQTTIVGVKYWNLYAHLNAISIQEGQLVSKGDFIGLTGKTGNASDEMNANNPVTPHVHIEFRIPQNGIKYNDFEAIDPEKFLATQFSNTGNPTNNPCS